MQTVETNSARLSQRIAAWLAIASTCFATTGVSAGQNLLKNPGFEEPGSGTDNTANWTTRTDSAGKISLIDGEAHAGQHCVSIPAGTSVEQTIESVPAGAYVARCWVKSQTAQAVTVLLQDPDRPWEAYSCSESKVAAGQWVQLEAFCNLDLNGSLSLTLGGVSKEFRLYHGTAGEMTSPIVADDFELMRYEPIAHEPVVWDAQQAPGPAFDWSGKDKLSLVQDASHDFTGSPVVEARQVVGAVRRSDGGVVLYAVQGGKLKQRCVLVPTPAIPAPRCSLVHGKERTGFRISSASGDRVYTAWFSSTGMVSIETSQVPKFQVKDCRLRYGLLPSFAGTDICYAPAKMLPGKEFSIPSTQWLVGLVDGNDSMLVAVWEAASQEVSLGLSGEGQGRMIDSFSIDTKEKGFSVSLVEHERIWHEEALKEDWLGEYVPISWERPFSARWMSHFFVTSGRPSFREPYLDYSFPIACAKTRMWGVWFEDWNRYPCFFEGQRTMFHFEKSFVPNGNALIYFLEPAAADLYSPCEIVEEALGTEKAAALFDLDANQLRKLKYSTPNQFMYDRPVCATTTRLGKIKQNEKASVGINLATHLYEFIREIRGRVDQYAAFFNQMKDYLASEDKAHPELRKYIAELQSMVGEAQSKTDEIYATPLPEVEKKIEAMKAQLREGKGDGYECGKLDVRDTAGSQDDLCRWYNRLVLRFAQTAALKCGDSQEKAVVAKHVWDESRKVVRQPTRWESRRTLYFFEP